MPLPASKRTLMEELSTRVRESKCDEVQILNMQDVVDSPRESFETINCLLKEHKEAFVKNRNDLTLMSTLEKTSQLGPVIDALKKRLQDHARMLKQTETTTKQPNAVLEHDVAKRRADKLAEILRAKLIWDNTHEELQLIDASDISTRYQKLVSMQQSFEILEKYSLDKSKAELFEKMKEEFLAWYSPATILAIDSNDVKQLENIREKYQSLGRAQVFESNIGGYVKSKIKSFVEAKKKEGGLHLWEIFEEIFTIWKRCYKLADSFIQENGSEFICKHLNEAITTEWETMIGVISSVVSSAESPFEGIKFVGKILCDFTALVENDGDEHIFHVFDAMSQSFYGVLSEDYEKHVTSVLLCTINKITLPEKGAFKHQHNWLMPFLEDIQFCMRDIVNEAKNTFGANFSKQIVPSFEHGIREINSLLQNQDVLNIKTEGSDIRKRKSIQENTEDKISAICATGYLLNMVDDINNYINEVASEVFNKNEPPPKLITKYSLLETLNFKVVERKIESIANTVIFLMEEEMQKMKQAEELATLENLKEEETTTGISLPNFSISPQNYVTGIGHGLLSQMNTISAYGNDRNFVAAISSAASERGSPFNEEEADLWLLVEVAAQVQNAFCSNVGKVSKLSEKLKRQFSADIVFLMDALADLRLQPTSQLINLAEKLCGNS